jgi:hypothetical protein
MLRQRRSQSREQWAMFVLRYRQYIVLAAASERAPTTEEDHRGNNAYAEANATVN